MSDTFAIELKGVTKVFGQIVANKDVNLQVKKGEILAILGENGSGKTTLMNMLSGIYFPDEGQIYVNGEEVVIKSPRDAFKYGIGMVHQHFKLVDVFTATENIVLGINDKEKFNIKKAEKKVKEITDKYGFDINLESKVYEMYQKSRLLKLSRCFTGALKLLFLMSLPLYLHLKKLKNYLMYCVV